MEIPRSYIDNYSKSLNKISEEARSALSKALNRLDYDASIEDIRNAVISVMQPMCGASADTSARLASEFYNGLRSMFGVQSEYTAEAVSLREPDATSGAVRAFVEDLVENKPLGDFIGKCADRIDYETRRAANECVAYNAKNDPKKPRWARIPTGAETCQFCIMLASRGFVYHSEETASHAHAHCDCRVVPSWDKAGAEGYDPDKYYDMWKHPEKYEQESERAQFSVDDIGTRPIRPKRADYQNEDELQAVREKYRKDRDEFDAKKEKLIKQLEDRPINGYGAREAVQSWAKSRGVVIESDVFEKIDKRTISEIVETTDRLFDKYPIVLRDKKASGEGYTIRFGSDKESYFMESSGGLNLNPSFFGTRTATVQFTVDGYTEERYNEYVGRNLRGIVRGDGTFATQVTHEFGHNVDEAIRFSRFYEGEDIDFENYNKYSQELRQLTIKYSTSEYSLVNDNEAFAEGFAEMECNPNSEYAKAFRSFLDRWL